MSTVKVHVLTDKDELVPLDATWVDVGDAAGDINGGDFWNDIHHMFPKGVVIKEIRIIPSEPMSSREYDE